MSVLPQSVLPSSVLVAVDIEKAGSSLTRHPVVAVGFYVGDEQGRELETKRFNLKVKWPEEDHLGDFEPSCWKDFWKKQPEEVVVGCLKDVLPQHLGWTEIGKYIDSLEKYGKVKFLTDNASFDVGNIDFYLERYTDRKPMRYSSKGKYRGVISADDMFAMLPKEKKRLAEIELKERSIHDHNPVNDAKHIYFQYVLAMKHKD